MRRQEVRRHACRETNAATESAEVIWQSSVVSYRISPFTGADPVGEAAEDARDELRSSRTL